MSEVSLEKRFRGTARLVTLHLWRVGASTDLDTCFRAARELGMIDQTLEAFLRACLYACEQLEAGQVPDMPITSETVCELQANALRLNAADPA